MKNTTEKVIPLNLKKANIYMAEEEHQLGVLASRIKEARERVGMSKKELHRQLLRRGIEVAYLSVVRWEQNEGIPNAYQLLAICDILDIPDSYTYFMNCGGDLNAEGLRKLAEYHADLVATGKYQPTPAVRQPVTKYVKMPVSTLPVSAGTGDFLDEGNFEMLRFPESSVPYGAEFAVRVDGDSMEPVYQDRQLVWVQKCSELRPGEVGIFVLDGDGFIKAYEEQEPEEDELDEYTDSNGIVHNKPVLISYNEAYAPRAVKPASRFEIIGRVLN